MDVDVMKAREFAVLAHGEQKYSYHPYVVHLDEVARIVEPYGVLAQVVAYLHDVLEDTEATEQDLIDAFGPTVADLVGYVTDCEGKNRKERKALTHAKLARVGGAGQLALVVKTADRLANVRRCVKHNLSLLKMYQGEHPAFRDAVYRQGLCPELWAELDRIIGGAL